MFERFLRAASRGDVAIEINTAGLRKDCKEMYPSPAILEMAARERVALTFGSDAHAPGEVGMDFQGAIALARQVGHRHTRQFTRRSKTDVAL